MAFAEDVKALDSAAVVLPQSVRMWLSTLSDAEKAECEEVRMRAGGRVCLTGLPARAGPSVTGEMILRTLDAATGASMQTKRESVRAGFVTIAGGHRVGICGGVAVSDGVVQGFSTVSSLNIRVAREKPGVAAEVYARISSSRAATSVLVVSPPGYGKTTFLRDLIRLASNGGRRVAVADERGELAACRAGMAQFDVGTNTDVLDGCPKAEGIMMLTRAMNPEIIALDEITAPEDSAAIMSAANCGVGFFATAHAQSADELRRRQVYAPLISQRVFGVIVYIRKRGKAREYLVQENM